MWISAILVLAVLITRQIVQSEIAGRMMVLLVLAAAVIILLILRNWRTGLCAALVWLVLDDLPRKYLGNNIIIYFGKDVLMAAAYVSFFLAVWRRETECFRPPFLVPLIVFIVVCLVQIFNPNSPSLLYGLLGIKLYLYYIPLLFLGYALVTTEDELRRFLVFNLALAGVVAVLGITQAVVGSDFLSPATTPSALNLLRLVRVAPLSGTLVPRPTSVFVSDGRFAWYMMQSLFLALASLGYTITRHKSGQRMSVGAVALIVAAILLSGSRHVLLIGVASVLIFAIAFLWGMPQSLRFRAGGARFVGPAMLAVGGSVLAVSVLFPNAVGPRWTFYYETLAPWSSATELVYRAQEYPLENFIGAFGYPNWPIGYGTGTSAFSLGGQYAAAVFDLPRLAVAVESGYGSLLLEMGIPGLLAWLAWTLAFAHAAWTVVRELRGTPLFSIGFGIFWFAFVLLFPMTYAALAPYQNFLFNAFLWLLIGVLFRLPRLLSTQSSKLDAEVPVSRA